MAACVKVSCVQAEIDNTGQPLPPLPVAPDVVAAMKMEGLGHWIPDLNGKHTVKREFDYENQGT